jgi:hypothetical protein
MAQGTLSSSKSVAVGVTRVQMISTPVLTRRSEFDDSPIADP